MKKKWLLKILSLGLLFSECSAKNENTTKSIKVLEQKDKNEFSKDFSLVLSGGGAMGIAHIGVIEDLEKNNMIPKEIIGTSMGGIVGACLSIGMTSDKIYNLIEEFSKITKWIKFSFDGNAIIKTDKIEKIFKNIFKDKKMNQTNIPLKLIATDLTNYGEAKVFSSKDDVLIVDALLATMAIPGVFEERVINNKIYVDGFLGENLGILYTDKKNILAVDVLGKYAYDTDMPNQFLKTPKVLSMLDKSMRLLILNQTKKNIKLLKDSKNLIIIEPDTKDFKTYQFHKYKDIYQSGKGLLDEKFSNVK